MATALATPPKAREAGRPRLRDEYLHLYDVSWQTYESLLRDLGERPVRLTYDRGELEFMTISRRHGTLNSGMDMILSVLFEEHDLPYQAGGNMTFRREDLQRGLEPDDCYWVANVAKVLGKDELDFRVDPAPDLACEVDLSTSVMDRIGIYAGLGVPEVWRYRPGRLEAGLLQNGVYRWGNNSPLFPTISLDGVRTFLERTLAEDRLSLIRAFRAWVRGQLAKPTL